MKNYTKTIKRVIGLFLALTMLIAPWNNVSPKAATTTSDATSTSYTVEVKNQEKWTLISFENSTGPVTLTYTVDSYTATAEGTYGVAATSDVGADVPYGTWGVMSYNTTGNAIMKEGYTYSFTISMNGASLVYSGTSTSPDGQVDQITFGETTGSVNAATNFGIYNKVPSSAKLVNVTCVDATGNDLGLRSNKPCRITPENATAYTVTANNINCFYLSNKTPSDGPVTMTYTVDKCTNVFSATHNGLVATTDATAGWPHTYGSMRFAANTNKLMMQGYTYIITMSLDSSNKIQYAGNYVAPDGTVTRITNGAFLNGGADGSGSASKYFGIFLSDITESSRPTITLSNVTFTDGKGKDLGVRTNNNNPSYIAPKTDATSYTVEVKNQSSWTLINFEESTGPVTLTYTVDSYTASAVETHGVTSTTDVGAQKPWEGPGRTAYNTSSTASENVIMKTGHTYSFSISMQNGDIVYSGTSISPEGQVAQITFADKLGNATTANYYGIYNKAMSSAKLINVTCVDAAGNDLGVRSNMPSQITPENATAYMVTAENVNCFYMSNKTPSDGPVTMTYTVDKRTTETMSTQNGLAATTDATLGWPHNSGSMRYSQTGDWLMRVGYTYSITMSLESDNTIKYAGNIVASDGTVTRITNGAILTQGLIGAGSESKYFGLFLGEIAEDSRPTITLSNVTFTDGNGNDLGVQSNQECVIAKKYDTTAYNEYLSGKTAPTTTGGYVFAGWFTNADCADVLTTELTTGNAYAKFVDEDVLSVKFQIPTDATVEQPTDLRLVTTVDSLDYKKVGFKVYVNGEFYKESTTKTVYRTITGYEDDNRIVYTPDVFSNSSEFFMAKVFTGVPTDVFSKTITIVPIWETLDGTTVEGVERDIVIQKEIVSQNQ